MGRVTAYKSRAVATAPTVSETTPKVHAEKVRRIMKKIAQAEPKLRDVAKVDLDDAKVAVVSFGASARPSYGAVKKLREEGIKAGLTRLKTLWPLPDEEFVNLANKVDAILVVEMNAGKLVREVQRAAAGNSISIPPHAGGVTPTQGDIAQELGGSCMKNLGELKADYIVNNLTAFCPSPS